jgi:hypothetical protein
VQVPHAEDRDTVKVISSEKVKVEDGGEKMVLKLDLYVHEK